MMKIAIILIAACIGNVVFWTVSEHYLNGETLIDGFLAGVLTTAIYLAMPVIFLSPLWVKPYIWK